MASLSVSKASRLNPNLANIATPFSLRSTAFFCSSPSSDSPNAEPEVAGVQDAGTSPPAPSRPLRGKHKNPEKLEDVISRMMANRAWTTRLQNSIRNLVPVFDHDLVYNVLHAAKNSEHALQFFRWVDRAGLFQHNRETHFKIIQILGRASKLNHARCILLDMPKKGVGWDEDLWVVMIESYGEAGIVQESVKLFQKMEELGVERTVKSYNALFKVISRRGRYMMSKRYFNKMVKEGIEPTTHTYNLLIWGFFLSTKVETASRFFEEMKSREVRPDVVTYNTMINGYMRVKKIEEAEKMFVEMKAKNFEPSVVTYTTLIKGYNSVGQVDDALRLFGEMKCFGIKPNAITYSTLLPGLCDAEKMSEAESILKEMEEKYIAPKENSIFVRLITGQCKAGDLDAAANVLKSIIRLSIPTEAGHYGVLIENFCKAGSYERAIQLLDKLIEKGIILRPENTFHMESSAYNVIIEYLCNNGQTGKAEALMRQLMKIGVQDPVALNNLIRGHASEGAPESASELLKIMVRRKVLTEGSAYKSLVDSYLKKGEPSDAKTVLDSMIENGHLPDSSLYRSVMESLFEDGRVQTASRVMKTMLDKGVKEHLDLLEKILEALLMRGHVEEALGRIDLMMQSGLAPDLDRLLSVLCEKEKTIAALKLLDFGLERDFSIDFSSYDKVLDALLAAGKTLNAYSVLCKITEKGGATNHSSCEELIKSLNKEGNTKQADILSRMIKGNGSKKGMKKNGLIKTKIMAKTVTIVSSSTNTILWLRNRVLFTVESLANRNSSYAFCTAMNKHLVNLTKQISAYAMKGEVGFARILFDEMGYRDTVSWNVMIKSYIENNRLDDARELFDKMPERTSYSWNSMIMGYIKDSKLYAALKLFTVMPEKDVVSWTAIITGMCRASRVDEAWWLFKQMSEANSVSWSSIVSGFQQNGFPQQSLHVFKEMLAAGFHPTSHSITSALAACADLAMVSVSEQVYSQLYKRGFNNNTQIGNSAISMFIKSGSFENARRIFMELDKPDTITWNSMIMGYAQHGHGVAAMATFHQMQKARFLPDRISFLGVLHGCSHCGLVNEGKQYFHAMQTEYGISPGPEHFASLVDLLSRVGELEEANEVILNMPFDPTPIFWRTLLNGCRIYGNLDLGIYVADQILKLEPYNSSACLMVIDMYALAGKWKEVAEMRRHMQRERESRKELGSSLIDIKGKINLFTTGDDSHPQTNCIYPVIDLLSYEAVECFNISDANIS